MKKSYWIRFKNSDIKKDKELVYKMLTDLRIKEMDINA